MRRTRLAGFTLIELLVTVTIVMVLAAIALPLAEVAVQRGKEQDFRNALREIRVALDAYKQAVDEKRIVKTADQSGYPPSLEILVEGVKDAKSADGKHIYFLRRLPRDPMADDRYAATQSEAGDSWGKRSYESPPDDPKEGRDVFDVYSKSDGIGLNGIPYREW